MAQLIQLRAVSLVFGVRQAETPAVLLASDSGLRQDAIAAALTFGSVKGARDMSAPR